jgi:hypothetical protein
VPQHKAAPGVCRRRDTSVRPVAYPPIRPHINYARRPSTHAHMRFSMAACTSWSEQRVRFGQGWVCFRSNRLSHSRSDRCGAEREPAAIAEGFWARFERQVSGWLAAGWFAPTGCLQQTPFIPCHPPNGERRPSLQTNVVVPNIYLDRHVRVEERGEKTYGACK